MKIALINLVVDTNYGGNLQRYALCKVLNRLGHDVLYIPTYSKLVYPHGIKAFLIYTKRRIHNIICKDKKNVFLERNTVREYITQLPQVNQFIKRNIPCYNHIYEEYDNMSGLNKCEFDAFLVGSDQVWRSSSKSNIEHFFLDFVSTNQKKIAYAVSFGNDGSSYTKKQILHCGKLYKNFDAISFREETAFKIIKKFKWNNKNKPSLVLDPTLLLNKEDYTSLIDETSAIGKKGIFCYILDMNPNVKELIDFVSKKKQLPYFLVDTLFPNRDHPKNGEFLMNPSIEQWLKYISEADFIITDSFHGTMFSLIFNKPFITIVNAKRGGERYFPLIKNVGLNNRLVTDLRHIDWEKMENVIQSNINYNYINRKIDEERVVSINFLKNNLY